MPLLDSIHKPTDVRRLSPAELTRLAEELRGRIFRRSAKMAVISLELGASSSSPSRCTSFTTLAPTLPGRTGSFGMWGINVTPA